MAGSTSTTSAPDLAPGFARRSSAVWNLFFNYAIAGVTLINGIILVPLYLEHFSLSTYGSWLASGNVLSLIGIFELGLNLVFSQRLASSSGERNVERFVRYGGAGLFMTAISAALIALVGLGISPWIPTWVKAEAGASASLSTAFAAAAVGAGATVLQLGLGSVVQSLQEPLAGGIAGVCGALSSVLAILVGLKAGFGVAALGFGALSRGAVAVVILSAFTLKSWRRRRLPFPRVHRIQLVELVRATAPVFVGRVGGMVVGNSEALLVSLVMTPEAAAVLALTSRIYQACLMFLAPVGSSVFAGVAHLASETADRIGEVLNDVFGLMSLFAGLLLGGALALNPSFVAVWIGPSRFGGVWVSLVACMAMLVSSRIQVAGMVLMALGRIGETAWMQLAEVVVRLPLIYVLVKALGIAGSPLATIVSGSLVTGLGMAILLARAVPSRRSLMLAGLPTTVACLALGAAIAWLPFQASPWLSLMVRGGLTAVSLPTLLLGFSPLARQFGGRAYRWTARRISEAT